MMSGDFDSKVSAEMTIEQCKSENDYYGLFLDPESLIYYRKIFGRDDFIRLESLEVTDDDIRSYNGGSHGYEEKVVRRAMM